MIRVEQQLVAQISADGSACSQKKVLVRPVEQVRISQVREAAASIQILLLNAIFASAAA